MATASDIVELAFRKIGLKAEDQALTADEESHGVDTLNNMLFGWELMGVDTSHTTLTDTSTFPLDDKYIEGTVYQLAMRLSPDYVIPPSFDADGFFRAIQAAYHSVTAATLDGALTRMPSQTDREYGVN